ncbi:MAG: hypothetical protein AAFY71_19690 [Bacteroidota bacterium]
MKIKHISIAVGIVCLIFLLGALLKIGNLVKIKAESILFNQRVEAIEQAPQLLKDLSKQEEVYQERLNGNDRKKSFDSPSSFLTYLDTTSRKFSLHLLNVPQEKKSMEDGIEIGTLCLSIKGNFKSMLKWLYQIEELDHSASAKHLYMEVRKEGKKTGRQSFLYAEVCFSRLISDRP